MLFSDFPLTWSETLIACLITVTGSTIQGAVGIGLGFIAVPLLVLITPDFVPGPLLLSALLLTVLISYREQRSIDFYEEVLNRKFTAMEQAVSAMQAQSAFLQAF